MHVTAVMAAIVSNDNLSGFGSTGCLGEGACNVLTELKIKVDTYRLLLVCAFCYDSLSGFVVAVCSRLPIIQVVSSYIPGAIIVVLLLLNILKKQKVHVYATDLILVTAILGALALTYIFFPSNIPYYNEMNMKNVFFKAIPFFFLGQSFHSDTETVKWLTLGSYISILLSVIYLWYFISAREMMSDNMHWSYLILPHTLLSLRSVFDKNIRIPPLIKSAITIIGVIYVVAMGTRGPILVFIVYAGVLIWKNYAVKNVWRIVVLFFVLGFLIYIIVSGIYLQWLAKLSAWLTSNGLSVRAIQLLVEGEYLSHTSGRDLIYEELWGRILENPLGYGVFGEWQFIDYVAHNIFLELCMHYGLLVGGALYLAYAITVARAYFKSESNNAKDFILLFAVYTFVRGIFGGDYFSDYFFFLLGLSMNQLRACKHHETHWQEQRVQP